MQKKNTRFDIVVENLASKFSQIPNFDLTRTDPTVNKLFNMMVFRINDINSYKELVCTKFIPAVQKLVADSKNEISRSKYASLFDKSLVDYNETYYDTVRLSYVGLFHKLENYMNELLQVPEEIFPEAEDSDATVEEWAKKKFNFKIKDWKRFRVTEKINWTSNCVKHYDSYPKKLPKPSEFSGLVEDQRLKLTHQEFKKDCEELLEFYPVFFNVINALSSIKQYYDVLLPAIEDIGKENFSANKQLLLAVEDQKIQEAIAALTKYE